MNIDTKNKSFSVAVGSVLLVAVLILAGLAFNGQQQATSAFGTAVAERTRVVRAERTAQAFATRVLSAEGTAVAEATRVVRAERTAQAPTKSPTQLPTASKSPTQLPTATISLPRPTDVPTASATATKQVTMTVETEIPFEHFASLSKSDILVMIIQEALERELESWQSDSDPTLRAIRADLRALQRIIDFDLEHNYPLDLPFASTVLNEKLFETELFSNGDWDLLWRIARSGFIDYLNRERIQFDHQERFETPHFEVTPYEAQLDSDPTAEWLLVVSLPSTVLGHGRIWGVIALDVDASGTYRLIANDLPPNEESNSRWATAGMISIDVSVDLTGDGQNEIILIKGAESGPPARFLLEVGVYTWDDEGVHLLEWLSSGSSPYEPRLEIADSTSDERSHIRITMPTRWNFDCTFDRVRLYKWNGTTPEHHLENTPPETPTCQVWQAIDNKKLTPVQRVALLSKALAAPDDKMTDEYRALVYLHLAMNLASQRQDSEAWRTLENLRGLSSSSPFVQTVLAEIEMSNNNPLTLCRALYNNYATELTELFDNWLYMLWETSFAGGRWEAPLSVFQARLCPLPRLIESRLLHATMPATLEIEEILIADGFELLPMQKVNLDDDSELEWIGFVEPNSSPFLVIFDQDGLLWQAHLIEDFGPIIDSQLEFRRSRRYRQLEIAALIESQNLGTCSDKVFSALLIKQSAKGYQTLAKKKICQEPPLLTEIDQAFFAGQKIDESEQILERIDELEEQVLSQNRTKKVDEINKLIESLPSDDQLGFKNRLTYLAALNNERLGKDEQARITYQSLLEDAPDSLWAWLAWTKRRAPDMKKYPPR